MASRTDVPATAESRPAPRHLDLGDGGAVGAIGDLTTVQVAQLDVATSSSARAFQASVPNVRADEPEPAAATNARRVSASLSARNWSVSVDSVVGNRDDVVGRRGLPGPLPEQQCGDQHQQKCSGGQVRREPARVSQPARLC